MKPLRPDEWLCVTVLALVTVLFCVDATGELFLYAIAAGTALLTCAAVCRADVRRELLLLGFLLPISMIATTVANQMVLRLTPYTIDAELFRMGHGMGASIYHWTEQHFYLYWGLRIVYYGLPLYGAFVLLVSPCRFDFARAWVVAALPAPLFYLAFPAVGPAHIGDPTAFRNCVPSLHLTWAILGLVYSGPRWRWFAITFTALTAAATLGIGEHYAIDLVVAIPYTLAACWIANRTRQVWPGSQPAESAPA